MFFLNRYLKYALAAAFILAANTHSFASEASTPTSILDNSYEGGTRYRITALDGENYIFKRPPVEVSAGRHRYKLLICSGDGGNCNPGPEGLECDIEPGYLYRADTSGCHKVERRTDFAGADQYWSKIDAEVKAKQLAARNIEIENEEKTYQANKIALAQAKTSMEVEEIIKSLEMKVKFGFNKNDPDNLLAQASEAKHNFLKAENTEKKRRDAELAKQEAELARQEKERVTAEKIRIKNFRKSLAEGDDTNCGPVIEVKGKLVKIAHAVANYGNEHWLKRDEVFPAGYSCYFFNGQYQLPR